MSESEPGFSHEHAGDVGSRRVTVGEPTDPGSINVPPTRPGAAENAEAAQEERESHDTFVPQDPIGENGVPSVHAEPEARELTQEEQMSKKSREETVSDIKDRAADAADATKAKAASAADAVKAQADVAKSKVADAADIAKGKAADVADKLPDQVKDAATEAKKKPILLIAALGAVAALVVRRLLRRKKD